MTRAFPNWDQRAFPIPEGIRDFPTGGNPFPTPMDLLLVNTDGFIFRADILTAYTDAGVTNVTADGDLVQQVNDLTINAHNFSQGTSANRPLWISPLGLFFDGSNDRMTTLYNGLAAAGTFAARCTPSGLAGTDTLMGNASGLNRRWLSITSGRLSMGIGDLGSDTFQDSGDTDLQSLTINVFAVWSGGNAQLYLNDALVGSSAYGGTVDVRSVYLGARHSGVSQDNFFPGDIIAALAVSRAISAVEVTSLSAYWDTL